MTFEQRKTPGGQTGGIPETHHSQQRDNNSSIADRGEFFSLQNHGIYIVIAEIRCESGKRFRRRFYANLPSAQHAVDLATQSGREAHLLIGQVTIVDGDAR